jgi:hypothetical protein
MSLKTFTGFRGVACLAQVGHAQFVIIASTEEQLQDIYEHLLPEAAPFNPAMCQKSVMIQADLLPDKTI